MSKTVTPHTYYHVIDVVSKAVDEVVEVDGQVLVLTEGLYHWPGVGTIDPGVTPDVYVGDYPFLLENYRNNDGRWIPHLEWRSEARSLWGKPELALDLSIAKWSLIADRRFPLIVDHGRWTCALCKVYWKYAGERVICMGCPVRDVSGLSSCINTPYYLYDYNDLWDRGKTTAATEYHFLKGLKHE